MSPVAFRPARREAIGLLVGFAGASGSGKTFSALRLAKGLSGGKRFAFIDTENGRALHYADDFDFDHGTLDPPFRPERYLEAVQGAKEAGYDVIVVDSASHEYSGPGGLQDWAEEELDRLAGSDQGKRQRMSAGSWTKPKTAHARFVSDLLRVHAHIILCFRARQAIEMVRDGGKTVIRPTQALDSFDGWLIDTEHKRMPLPFELTCSFLMLPDQPGVPKPIKLPNRLRPLIPLDRPIGEEVGAELAKWASGVGEGTAPSKQDAEIAQTVQKLFAAADALGKRDVVTAAVAANRRDHSSADHLEWLRPQLASAEAKVAERAGQTDAAIDFDGVGLEASG
jgi:hypothetical protein